MDRRDAWVVWAEQWVGKDTARPCTQENFEAGYDAGFEAGRRQGLLDAADEWSEWEVYEAADGHRAIRQHGKSPDEWLRERAAEVDE